MARRLREKHEGGRKVTGFNTQVGGGLYRIQIETDRKEVYDEIQRVARSFVDSEPQKEKGKMKYANLIKEYHRFHGDTCVQIVERLKRDIYLVRVVDEDGKPMSVIDLVTDGYCTELYSTVPEREEEIVNLIVEDCKNDL